MVKHKNDPEPTLTESKQEARDPTDGSKLPKGWKPSHGANLTDAPSDDKPTKKKKINLPGG